jgi:hypothetical protein
MLARWCSLGQTEGVSLLLCLLLAASTDGIVEGRVGEPGGSPAAFAHVRLAQGDRLQVVRTGVDGKFRFRVLAGMSTLTVTLPQGWTSQEPLSRTVGPTLRGEVIHADFAAVPRRVLRGRLLVAGVPLPEVELSAGAVSATTDRGGMFAVESVPAGALEIRVEAPPLVARIDLPAGAAELSRDVGMEVPDFASLRLTPVPQATDARPIADWLSGKPLSRAEISRLERLAALVGLDPVFRLAMVVPAADAARGAQAAARLQRYLTGPALVPRERLLFAVGEFAPPRSLQLLLARAQEPR